LLATPLLMSPIYNFVPRLYDMNVRYQMQGGKNQILPKAMNANRFFRTSHWLEIWKNHFCPSMGPNGGSVAMDSGRWQILSSAVLFIGGPTRK
jgi:hypothetical protein